MSDSFTDDIFIITQEFVPHERVLTVRVTVNDDEDTPCNGLSMDAICKDLVDFLGGLVAL